MESDSSTDEPPVPPQNLGKKRKTVDGHIPGQNKRADGLPKRKYTKHKQMAAAALAASTPNSNDKSKLKVKV